MTKIYCITAWSQKNEMLNSVLFMSTKGLVKYIKKQNPIDNKYSIPGEGTYDISEDNIANALANRLLHGMALTIKIKQDYGVILESNYTISIIMAED